MEAYDFYPGVSPVLLSIPHAGTHVPKHVADGLTEEAVSLPDTDWCVDRLYAFAHDAGAHVIRANYSRVVVDLNRPPDDTPLYAGATTGLFPEVLFDGGPVLRYMQFWCIRDSSGGAPVVVGFGCLLDAVDECGALLESFEPAIAA